MTVNQIKPMLSTTGTVVKIIDQIRTNDKTVQITSGRNTGSGENRKETVFMKQRPRD